MERFVIKKEIGTTKFSPIYSSEYYSCQATLYQDTTNLRYYLVLVNHFKGGFNTMLFESDKHAYRGSLISKQENFTREEIFEFALTKAEA